MHSARTHIMHSARTHIMHSARPHIMHSARTHIMHSARPHIMHSARTHIMHSARTHIMHTARTNIMHSAKTHIMHSARTRRQPATLCESCVSESLCWMAMQAVTYSTTDVPTLLLPLRRSTCLLILPHNGPLYGAEGLSMLLCGPHRQCAAAVWLQSAVL